MSDNRPTASRIRIVARPPLLRAGLERLVARAGLSASDADDAAITIRGSDEPATGADVDLAVDSDTLTITIRRPPDPATWDTVRLLVPVLLGTDGRSDPVEFGSRTKRAPIPNELTG